ncbi:MAG: S8 family serine peptidase [Crocinitomicaceae bacterium]
MIKLFSSLIFSIFFSIMTISQSFMENELLIQIKSESNSRLISEKLAALGGQPLSFFKCISEPMKIYHLKFDNDVDLDFVIKNSAAIAGISVVQKNHLVTDRLTIPDDTYFGEQWHLHNTGQAGGTVDSDIDAPEAWDVTTGGNTSHGDTIVVCVIESQGVDINHIDLAGNMWKNYAEIPGNGIDDDNNGYVDDFDGWNVGTNSGIITSGSHGTRVAGMIGAVGDNGSLVSGVNHKVKMMVVQGQNANNESNVIAAYTYPLLMRKKYNETNGAEGAFVVVTNASWGIDQGSAANSPLWCSFYDSLGVHGILNIGATTNNSSFNVDVVGDLPTTCASEFLVGVTNTNRSDFRGGGYGPVHVDLAAPGTSVALTNPIDTFSVSTGTSFATPCVAGSVALLYSAPCTDYISYAKTFPDSAALKMRSLLLDNVDNISNLSGFVGSGGRLNMNNSLQALINSCDTSSCLTPYAVNFSNISDSSVLMTWQGSNNSGYIIEYGLLGASPSSFTISSSSINSDMIQGLTACSNYQFSIKGICGTDTSETSTLFYVKTDGCCNNPEITTTVTSETSIDLNWSPILSATEYVVRYQLDGDSAWIYDTISATTATINSLDTCKDYNIQVKTICGDSSQAYSQTYQIRTKGCGICYEGQYCEINDNLISTQFEWLESFTINGFTSTTGNNQGYFSGDVFGLGLAPGNGYPITFVPGYSGSNYTERYKLWIDMDQNGVFDASDELISSITGQGIANGMLFIPSTSMFGVTKMRVAMTGQTAPTLCANQGGTIYGEYEDYCIYIGDKASVDESELVVPKLFPNPSSNFVSINSLKKIDKILVHDLGGKIVFAIENPINNQFSVLDFESGIYMVSIFLDGSVSQQKLIKQ